MKRVVSFTTIVTVRSYFFVLSYDIAVPYQKSVLHDVDFQVNIAINVITVFSLRLKYTKVVNKFAFVNSCRTKHCCVFSLRNHAFHYVFRNLAN